jgi:hypothetical protein
MRSSRAEQAEGVGKLIFPGSPYIDGKEVKGGWRATASRRDRVEGRDGGDNIGPTRVGLMTATRWRPRCRRVINKTRIKFG